MENYLHCLTSYNNRQSLSWRNIHIVFLSPYSGGNCGLLLPNVIIFVWLLFPVL